MRNLANIFKIKHVTTSGYRPQTNGSLERSHIVLIEYLKHYIQDYTDWDKLVSFAMFSYNTSVHEATKFTPYELVFGKIARIPSAFPLEDKLNTYGNYLTELITRIEEIREIAAQNLITSKKRSKVYYDRNEHPCDFRPGDLVYALREPRLYKFDSQYTGPYKIIEILGMKNILLENGTGDRLTKHADKLKPARISNG